MTARINLEEISIRTTFKPGDIGYITYLHGILYHHEYGYSLSFESYVAVSMHEFYQQYNTELDRVWVCEHHNQIVGFLALQHRENNAAQLRYFILLPNYRGIGLGRKLMNLFMDYYHEKKYQQCYLLTTAELSAAAHLYTQYGFKVSAENETESFFGKRVIEQRYELRS